MGNRQYRVLLVEDDEAALNQIRNLLAQCGLRGQLTHATGYFDAIEEIAHAEYDLCLLSSTLGDGMGLQLLHDAAEHNFRAPFVLLTGEGQIDLEGEASNLGIADYLPRNTLSAPLLARVIAYTVERAEMSEALRELAIRDELTGLYNRRELWRVLTHEVSRSVRYHSPLSLLIIEVNRFSEIVERYGQPTGDVVLQAIAQLLRDGVRTTDRPARQGNQSLAVVLPETPRAGAMLLADRLKNKVASHRITVAGNDRRPIEMAVSVTIGVGAIPDDANSEDGLVAAASQVFNNDEQGILEPTGQPGNNAWESVVKRET